MAAESSFWKNADQGTIQLIDGTGTPVTLTLSTDQGNLKATAFAATLNAIVVMERRGKFGSLNRGVRAFPQLTLTTFMGNFVGSTTSAPGTPMEFLTKKGAYSANVSTLGASREYTVDVKLTVEGTNFGDTADETCTWEDCVLVGAEMSEAAEGNAMAYTLQCLGSVVVVNNTNTVTYSQVA